jgi:nicotinamide mononucleotide (NMN) deamidase PncC
MHPQTDTLKLMAPVDKALIEQIHASGKKIVLAMTGGGSGAISSLLQVPGASAVVVEAIVPYAAGALEDWLGGPVDQFCSERTARGMAMAAFQRARRLSNSDPSVLRGIGATASLASNRPKRGAHRIHVAWQSADTTAVATCEFEKGKRSRADEEHIAAQLILRLVAEACAVAAPAPSLNDADFGVRRTERASKPLTELLLGERTSVHLPGETAKGTALPPAKILFPGAFNPLHAGHARMADIASRKLAAAVTFELSIINVDKPPLDFVEIADRVKQLRGRDVLLTRAPAFVEKAQLAPGCVFVVGVDTIERIGQPRYYGNDAAQRDAAIAKIARQGCRFLVFGRAVGEKFITLADVEISCALRDLCDEVPQEEFREDVSSTDLRSRTPSS